MSLKSDFFHIVRSCPCIIFTNWRDCMPSAVAVDVEVIIIIIMIVCTEYFAKISKSPAPKNYKSLHHVNSKHAHHRHRTHSGFCGAQLTATTTIHPAIWLTTTTTTTMAGWRWKIKMKMKTENHIVRFTCTMSLQDGDYFT